jgi:hypothetical protein
MELSQEERRRRRDLVLLLGVRRRHHRERVTVFVRSTLLRAAAPRGRS